MQNTPLFTHTRSLSRFSRSAETAVPQRPNSRPRRDAHTPAIPEARTTAQTRSDHRRPRAVFEQVGSHAQLVFEVEGVVLGCLPVGRVLEARGVFVREEAKKGAGEPAGEEGDHEGECL